MPGRCLPGWSSMQSKHNARNRAASLMQAALTRNMWRHNGIHLGIASAAPHAKEFGP